MTMLPVSEVRRRFSEIADEVARTHDRVQVTRHGREHVVLIAAADLESLEATIELLSDPAAMARLKEADEAITAGDVVTRDEMALIIDERRREEIGA